MARLGDSYWIKHPKMVIDGNLARKDVCNDDKFRKFVWFTIQKEKERLDSIQGIDKSSAWTEADGINTLYFLPNGHRVLYNNDLERGTSSISYEDINDCQAERFKEWFKSRVAQGKPVTVSNRKIMQGTGKAKENVGDLMAADLSHDDISF